MSSNVSESFIKINTFHKKLINDISDLQESDASQNKQIASLTSNLNTTRDTLNSAISVANTKLTTHDIQIGSLTNKISKASQISMEQSTDEDGNLKYNEYIMNVKKIN